MNIGITGADGFIGKHLTERLKLHNISYVSMDRKKNNLLAPETLKDFVLSKDIIIHLAGKNKNSDSRQMEKINILGTRGLLEAIALYNPSVKIIFSSSFMVYVKEDIFGKTKREAEKLIEKYCQELPMRAIILRFSNIYGPGGKPFSNSVVSTIKYLIKRGETLKISGDGTQVRDFLYISDAVNAIIKAILYNPKGIEYFDICSGKLSSINEVVELLSILSNKKNEVKYDASIKNHPYNIHKDYLHAKEKLNWEPKITLEQGLRNL